MRLTHTRDHAFTLAELLVAVGILTLLIVLVARMVSSAASVTTLANKRMDTDSQARPLFDRMALDFAQILKRTDVSYYMKTAATSMTGNDLIGFYSAVQGYYSSTPCPVSVVAYRVNSDSNNSGAYNRLERMGKGLPWNGASTTDTPVVFLPLTVDTTWPSVSSSSAYDSVDLNSSAYEVIGPHVFRLEYYYLERATGTLVEYPATWSSPSAVAIKDIAAIVVAIAVIDPKSKVLLSNSQIATLAGSLSDYTSGLGPGQLLAQWQAALDSVTDMPRPAVSGIRLYERYFYISQ
jgi:hypothetical protein